MARPNGDVYAEQNDQWAVLRHEVEGEDMRWQEKPDSSDWEYERRDTDEDAISAQLSYSELEEAEN